MFISMFWLTEFENIVLLNAQPLDDKFCSKKVHLHNLLVQTYNAV